LLVVAFITKKVFPDYFLPQRLTGGWAKTRKKWKGKQLQLNSNKNRLDTNSKMTMLFLK
jgi:hypothetical protein